VTSSTAARRFRPLAACVLALLLAGAAEAVIRTGHSFWLSLALSIAAAAVFVPGAFPLPASTGEPDSRGRRHPWAFDLCLAASLIACGVGLRALSDEREATAGIWWIASSLLVLLAALFAGKRFDIPARWSRARFPATRAGRVAVIAALAVILAVAVATRLWGLGHVPYGINPDEGDRAAPAIQIVRGVNPVGIFGFGWYHISMVYFKLLAAVMAVSGLDVAGARVFGALCGIATVAIVTALGVRHFGWRAGLMSGGILASMGAAIQFSRITTEAQPTQTLWAISAAAFLEAARRGRAWAWAVAGMAGGLSLYFYPTGRLWCLIAIPFGLWLLFKGPRGTRARTAGGLAIAALASFLAVAPFLLIFVGLPEEFTIRAKETTVFLRENTLRLPYMRPEWSTARLLAAQLEHSLGIFNRYYDQNLTWPTELPLFPPVLAALTLLGLFAATAKVRDARLFLLALWFWVGFVGVIVTVETPNLHRMATAIPVLGLFAGLVLDETARRIGDASVTEGSRKPAFFLGTALAGGTAVLLAVGQLSFYFGPYASSDRWPWNRVEGETVAAEGAKGWAITLGAYAHMVNSGWVRLLAPNAHRLSVPTPGLELPLALPADRDLAFLLYSGQPYYLPYLEQIYPGGMSYEALSPEAQPVVTVYRVPLAKWGAFRGALVSVAGASAVRVPSFGEAPAGWIRFPAPMRWSAALRLPNYGNASFRAAGRVTVDGREILRAPAGEPFAEAAVSLPAGDHRVVFEGTVEAPGRPALFEWKGDAPGATWRRTETSELWAVDGPPQGLLGVFSGTAGPDRKHLDSTIASMSLGQEVGLDGEWTASWRGTLLAPADGSYLFGFRTNGGTVEMSVDGKPLWSTRGDGEKIERGPSVTLQKGPHGVAILYRVVHGPAGIDWIWTPPGQRESLVPPAALRPPADAGPGPPLSEQTLAALRSYRDPPGWVTVP
jgi:hypothetical protein